MDINGPNVFVSTNLTGPYTLEYVEKLSRERGQLHKALYDMCRAWTPVETCLAYDQAIQLLATIKI